MYFCRATLKMFTFSKGIKLRAIQYHALHKNVVHVKDQQRKDDFSVGCYWKIGMYSWLSFNCCYIILQYTLSDNLIIVLLSPLNFKIDKLIQVASKESIVLSLGHVSTFGKTWLLIYGPVYFNPLHANYYLDRQ